MPNHVTNIITLKGEENGIKRLLEKIRKDNCYLGSIDFNKVIPMPNNIYRGDLGPKERAIYGSNNWYDWSIANWGCNDNAYGFTIDHQIDDDQIYFLTAWSAPHPILEKLSDMYPDITFEHEWADEDIGMNCGRYVYFDGERIEEYFPESSKDRYEFAARVMDVDIEKDYFLYLNASETGYINLEFDDDYELIEVAGLTALFTNERISEEDIPKGMYCYHLRHGDNGEFCTIEKRVAANHAGSIVTKEPIDLGEQEFFKLDEESSPNFLGENMSLYMFREYDPDQTEEMNMGMTEV